MQRHNVVGLRALLMVTDTAVTTGAFFAAELLRKGPSWRDTWEPILDNPALGGVIYLVMAVGIFWLAGLYRLNSRFRLRVEALDVLRACSILAVFSLALLFMFDLDEVSRGAVAIFFSLEVIGLVVVRSGLRLAFRAVRNRGRAYRHLLVVGTDARVRSLATELGNDPEVGIRIVGFLGPPCEDLNGYRSLGDVLDLARVLNTMVVDEVLVDPMSTSWEGVEHVVGECGTRGKAVLIPTGGIGRTLLHSRIAVTPGGMSFLTLDATPDRSFGLAAKRLVDVAISSVGLLVLAPVLGLVGAVLLIAQGSPVLYVQERVGLHGRRFSLIKYRTMVCDADEQKSSLLGRNERVGPAFKLSDDPRITPPGRWLRRTSIDELPQLWNVLIGDMSLVGPRPPLVEEVERYDPWHQRRLSMKPGITGLWQVSARDECDFDRWVELDVEYIESWSPALDAKILARTLPAVLGMKGR